MNTKTTITALAVASLGMGAAAAATVTWDGDVSGGIWDTATNWDSNTVPAWGDDIVINTTNGSVEYQGVNGDYNPLTSLTVTNTALTNNYAGWQRSNGTIIFDNSSLVGNGNIMAVNYEQQGAMSWTLQNGSSFSSNGEFWMGPNNATQTGNTTISIDGTSNITLTGGGGASLFLWNAAASHTINFEGTGGFLSVGAAGIEYNNDNTKLSFEDLWDAGVLTRNGGQVGTFAENFVESGSNGSDGYTVTAIPEPSSTALIGLAGLALILRRRK